MSGDSSKPLVGILSRQDIAYEMGQQRLILNGDVTKIEACSYDLTIGTIFLDGQVINESHQKANDQVIIKPGQIVSMFTKEELSLPDDICATAYAINGQSSRGILVLNPGHVDPGFQGPLTVKAVNLRKTELAISRGRPIFTVIFERLPKKTDKPYNRNIIRDDREKKFNESDVEISPRSLSNLIIVGDSSPFATPHDVKEIVRNISTTPQDVKEIIRGHWISRWSLFLSLIAALFAVIAVIVVIFPTKTSETQRYSGADKGSKADSLIKAPPSSGGGKK